MVNRCDYKHLTVQYYRLVYGHLCYVQICHAARCLLGFNFSGLSFLVWVYTLGGLVLKGTVSPHTCEVRCGVVCFPTADGIWEYLYKAPQLDATTGQDRAGQRGDLEIA